MAHPSILLLDDDDAFRMELTKRIEAEGSFRVTPAATILEAEEHVAARSTPFDAMLLDVSLPDGNGRDLCARLRANGSRMPVLMLTGSSEEADVVRGLEAGADDYIAKPFRLGVLLARLRSQLRSWEAHADALLAIGPYVFQASSRTLRDQSGKRHAVLTNKEAEILRYLHRTSAQVVSRTTLLSEVWGYVPGMTTHTVETHIYRLRQKLEQDPTNPRILISHTGGYGLDLRA